MTAAGTVTDIYTQNIIPCPRALKNYSGNKKVEGLYHKIISIMPPHKTFVEAFAGSAAIYRYKLPSEITFLNDADPLVYDAWQNSPHDPMQLKISTRDSVDFLKQFARAGEDTLIYLDPPYLLETRASQKQLYNYEMSAADHVAFLGYVISLSCRLVISHYPCGLYNSFLSSWNYFDIPVSVRGRVCNERVYFNYQDPVDLHDYRYLGNDRTDRQRIRRKLHRLALKLQELNPKERNCILSMLNTSKADVDKSNFTFRK